MQDLILYVVLLLLILVVYLLINQNKYKDDKNKKMTNNANKLKGFSYQYVVLVRSLYLKAFVLSIY